MLSRTLLTAGLALLAGCQSLAPGEHFTSVQGSVHERIGQRVAWRNNSAEDAQAAAAVRKVIESGLTAEGAVQVALLNNRRLQAAYENLGIAQAAVVQAGLLKNPVFDVAVKFPSGGGSPNLEMAVVQEFLDVLFIPVRTRIADAGLEETKLNVTAQVLDTAGATRLAFFDVQAAQQTLEMRRQVVAANEASVEFAKRLRAAGNIRELDVANEQASLSQAKLDLASAESQLAEARERLTSLMGLWGDDTAWTIAGPLPDLPAQPPDVENIEKRAVAANLDLAIGKQRLAGLGEELGLAKATSLVQEFEAGVEAERDDGHWEVGPAIAVPIPLFDQGQAKVATSMARLRREQELLKAAAIELRSTARIARQRVISAHRTALAYQNDVLPLRQKITRDTLLQYNAMQVGVFQLLTARTQQIDAARRHIESLRDYWRAAAELDLLLAGRAKLGDAPRGPSAATSVSNEGH